MRCGNGTKFTALEGMFVLLFRMAQDIDFHVLSNIIGIENTQCSRIFNAMNLFLETNWSHLVSRNLALFVTRFKIYHAAIKNCT